MIFALKMNLIFVSNCIALTVTQNRHLDTGLDATEMFGFSLSLGRLLDIGGWNVS